MLALSVALDIIGVVSILVAVAALAGPWWAALLAGLLALYGGYLASTRAVREVPE